MLCNSSRQGHLTFDLPRLQEQTPFPAWRLLSQAVTYSAVDHLLDLAIVIMIISTYLCYMFIYLLLSFLYNFK